MTNEQIAQLQDLNKCCNLPMMDWVEYMLLGASVGASMNGWDKNQLRRLTHQYRHQIAAIKRNQKENNNGNKRNHN